MKVYYNEWDEYPAQWLRNLIAAGHLPPGDVDTRSITEVTPDDLTGYDQCHFFAGIGGWPLALLLAGWDGPVWTGSCPCQPFSAAGAQRGSEDERHLWPAFFDLIRVCRPPTVFGEQVAGGAGFAWWDHVAADLEGADYAVAAANLGAHSVGAAHIRQRLYWVANPGHGDYGRAPEIRREARSENPGSDGRMGDAEGTGQPRGGCGEQAGRRILERDGRMGNADDAGLEGRGDHAGKHAGQCAAGAASPWDDLEWLACSDGKARPTQPGIQPLAHGVSGRVGRLRAYGNAIIPQVGAAFIKAFMSLAP